VDARDCPQCGALIDPNYVNKHNFWHRKVEQDIQSAMEEARRAKRLAKS
jgi:hypothetical protein